MTAVPYPYQRIWDISVGIHPDMPVFPGDPGVQFEAVMDIGCGDVACVTRLTMGSQTGTHFDTPHHILNCKQTAETLPLETCIGPARVIALDDSVQAIRPEDLAHADLTQCTRLLLKTKNSAFWHTDPTTFRPDFAALTPEAATYLVEHGIRLVGIDYLSVECFGNTSLGAHKALLSAGVVILEGLDLSAVIPGDYILVAPPLKLIGIDGAMTRAVLLQ